MIFRNIFWYGLCPAYALLVCHAVYVKIRARNLPAVLLTEARELPFPMYFLKNCAAFPLLCLLLLSLSALPGRIP